MCSLSGPLTCWGHRVCPSACVSWPADSAQHSCGPPHLGGPPHSGLQLLAAAHSCGPPQGLLAFLPAPLALLPSAAVPLRCHPSILFWDRRRAISHGLPPCPGAWTRNAGTEQTVPFRGQTSSHTGCIARALQPVAPGSPALGKPPAVGYGFGIAPCSRALDSFLGEKSHAMGDLDVEGLAPWMASWSGLTPSVGVGTEVANSCRKWPDGKQESFAHTKN